MNITHYDLFAGIGGFSLALEEVFNEAKLTPRTRETEQDLEKFKARMAKYRNGTTIPNLATQIGAETGEKLRLQPAMPEWMMGFPEKWTEFPIASPNGETNQSKPTVTL